MKAEKEAELSGHETLKIAAGDPVDESLGKQAAAPVESGAPASPAEPVARVEFDQLKAERDQLQDRLARLQAEFENARKRAERERVSDREYATCKVVEQFLPVVDNFELALKSKSSEEQLRSGIELIVKQMDEILRQMQVTPIPAVEIGRASCRERV